MNRTKKAAPKFEIETCPNGNIVVLHDEKYVTHFEAVTGRIHCAVALPPALRMAAEKALRDFCNKPR